MAIIFILCDAYNKWVQRRAILGRQNIYDLEWSFYECALGCALEMTVYVLCIFIFSPKNYEKRTLRRVIESAYASFYGKLLLFSFIDLVPFKKQAKGFSFCLFFVFLFFCLRFEHSSTLWATRCPCKRFFFVFLYLLCLLSSFSFPFFNFSRPRPSFLFLFLFIFFINFLYVIL